MSRLRVIAVTASHRYWYFVNRPEIGVRWKQGWCFGTDALSAARNAIEVIGRDTKQAQYLDPGSVKVTHDTACSCIPPDQRYY